MPVRKSVQVIEPSDPSAVIWRYVDVAKLADLLMTETLFFCRADKLADPFEGSWPKANVAAREPYFAGLELPGADPTEIAETFSAHARIFRQFTFISCWHSSPHESMAMWQIYAGAGAGITIRSTYGRLVRALDRAERQIVVGLVEYVDFDSASIPAWGPDFAFFHKRHCFEYEHEVRAITHLEMPGPDREKWINAIPPTDVGLRMPVDLEVLIEQILVSPQAPEWFFDVVENLVAKLRPKIQVVRSNIATEPVF